ncbi:hypothetical protein C8R47DRAFT_1131586 [Mycena vitilis]|nr:hypothetical protein C8R47DRAFT_1131586 [Mycena vitilis]
MTVEVLTATAAQVRRIIRLDEWHLIGLTILFWDHAITLDTEITLLWRRRKSLSAYGFYINRYFGFFSGIAVSALPFLTLSLEECMRYSLFRELALVATQIITSIIMVIRVYALYGRSRRVLWGFVGIALGVIGVSVYAFSQQHVSRPTIIGGCHFDMTDSTAYRLAASWEAIFLFDSLVFGLTLYNAYLSRRATVPSFNLHMLVVYDGALYFAIMALANLANIATYYVPTRVSPGSLSTFSSCISVTMISRMILHLHEHANAGIMSGTTSSSPAIPTDMILTEPDFNESCSTGRPGPARPDTRIVSSPF